MKVAYRSDIGRIRLLMKIEVGPKLRIQGCCSHRGRWDGWTSGWRDSEPACSRYVPEALLGTTAALSMDERKLLIRQAILQANEVIFDMASQQRAVS